MAKILQGEAGSTTITRSKLRAGYWDSVKLHTVKVYRCIIYKKVLSKIDENRCKQARASIP